MTPDSAGALLRLQHAPTPEAAQAILLDAIDAGLNVVEACSAWHEWTQLSAASTFTLEAS